MFLLHTFFNTLILSLFFISSLSLLYFFSLFFLPSQTFNSQLNVIQRFINPSFDSHESQTKSQHDGIAIHERSYFVRCNRPVFLPLQCKTHPHISLFSLSSLPFIYILLYIYYILYTLSTEFSDPLNQDRVILSQQYLAGKLINSPK